MLINVFFFDRHVSASLKDMMKGVRADGEEIDEDELEDLVRLHFGLVKSILIISLQTHLPAHEGQRGARQGFY
jgi:hypothetical protein